MTLTAHNFDEDVHRPSHHSAVFCRGSCQAVISQQYGSPTMQMPIAIVRFQKQICILGMHSPPPAPIDATGLKPYVNAVVKRIDNGMLLEDFGVCKQGDSLLLWASMLFLAVGHFNS